MNDQLYDQVADATEELKEPIKIYIAAPRWIHVKECLPENSGEYLVYLRAPEKEREEWIKTGLMWDGSYVTTAYYNDRQKIWQIDEDAYNTDLSVVNLEDDYSISYWMPLPNAPEVKK